MSDRTTKLTASHDCDANDMTQHGATEDHLPDEVQMSKAFERLVQFADMTGTTAPARILSDDGAPSPELLTYCKANGLSLDWIFCGDPRAYLLASWRRAQAEESPAVDWRSWLSDLHVQLILLQGLTEGAAVLRDDCDIPGEDLITRRASNALNPLLEVIVREVQRIADHVGVREDEVCRAR